MTSFDYDAIVVGAGFAGIYMCKKLIDQGLTVKVIEAAPDVGGTWYWNRYPGAMSDTRSILYRYSWDLEDLREYPWGREYLKGPEVLTYLQHVVKRHNLRQYMVFNTAMEATTWNGDQSTWTVSLSTGEKLKARYVVSAVGILSKQNYPDIAGLNSFKGETYHTSRWPATYDFQNKRVGVIGNGSTGVQVITALADHVKHLTSFQRHPQYVVPAGDKEISPETRREIDDNWDSIWSKAKNSTFAFGFKESTVPTFSVSDEEREQIFEKAWQYGSGFYFMFGTFCDISYNEDANRAAQDFIRGKIAQKVKDPVKANKLMPRDWFARRPLCDTGYYEKFNKPNVDVVDIKSNPISEITPTGIRTQDGTEFELDALIFATGFDAVDGSYKKLSIVGANQKTLGDAWKEAPESYLGISVPEFPNFFMVLGPNSPFTNIPPTIETQVEFISDMIEKANQSGTIKKNQAIVEAEPTATKDWCKQCDDLSAESLFRKTDSWIFGANVAGKKTSVLFYFGGLANYRKALQELVENGNRGFKPF
ncbi:hypothetical protein N7478_001345 [Penicillium angulare]|uniref:uncharacterized protein n=1 Tax=Penicillium angulare TaxID=116970 RepID=UPI0025424511|nr:uncharacterized protein N7478_001345 [Penicillium angulare]KAJ5292094.1 hypothetical protein N7478_001345 [Penicillium angulare]